MVATPAGRSAQSQAASTFTTAATTSSGIAPSGAPSASRARSRGPQPRSVSRPRARPGSADSIRRDLPVSSTPSSAMPVGHIFRGVTATPGRSSRSRAAVAAAGETSAGQCCPVQLSHRPHRAAAASSSSRRRYSIRHSVLAR